MPRVNPDILSWARISAGLDVETAAKGIGLSGPNAVERLQQIESGEREPTRAQLRRMSERYRRPLLTFYLLQRPVPGPQTCDFRNLRQREPDSEAILNALVRDVKTRQTLLREALEDADELEGIAFVGSVGVDTPVSVIANEISKTLKFDRRAYRSARSYDDAFRLLREATERIGVVVILKGNLGHHTSKLGPDVFRGIALADPIVPFIVVNETDSKSAWPFTLLHEICHLFLGQTGVSGYGSENEIEQICNDVAAMVLVDNEEFHAIKFDFGNFEDTLAQVNKFAFDKKVSRKMVSYNLLKVGKINFDVYRDLIVKFDQERIEGEQRRKTPGAPDYYVVRRHRAGARLVSLVARMVSEGTLTSTKAGKVLGVKPTAVGKMTERVA